MKRKIIIIPICLIILAICCLPLPERINKTIQGVQVTEDTITNNIVNISIKGWRLNYLFRENKIKGTLNIFPYNFELDNIATYDFMNPIFSDTNIHWSSMVRYSAKLNQMTHSNIFYDSNFENFMISENNIEDGYYIAYDENQDKIIERIDLFKNYLPDVTKQPTIKTTTNFTGTYMLVDNLMYCLTSTSQTRDLTNAEYIGELIGEIPNDKGVIDNMTANFPVEGTKVYKIDDETMVVEHERIIDGKSYAVKYSEMKLYNENYNRYIRIEGNLCTFPSSIRMDGLNKYNNFSDCPNEYDLSQAEYIGDIVEKLDLNYKLPTEHLTSNYFPVGSKVYIIDDSVCVVYYEINNKKIYSVGYFRPRT